MLGAREQREIRILPSNVPYGPGSIINQLYHTSMQLLDAINKHNDQGKWALWIAFQKLYARALKSARNIDEELPIPDDDTLPDYFLESDFFDDISDEMMLDIVQPVIDRIEKKLFKKALSIHG